MKSNRPAWIRVVAIVLSIMMLSSIITMIAFAIYAGL